MSRALCAVPMRGESARCFFPGVNAPLGRYSITSVTQWQLKNLEFVFLSVRMPKEVFMLIIANSHYQ